MELPSQVERSQAAEPKLTTALPRALRSSLFLLLSFLGLLLLVAATASALPPVSGDWVITGPEVLSASGHMVNGSVIIAAGGSLTLENGEVLVINCATPGEFGMQVNASGMLRMRSQAALTSFIDTAPYTFEAQPGSTIELRDSLIEQVGFMLGTNGTGSGVVVRTSDVTIVDVTLYDSYQGLVVDGATVNATGLSIQFVSWAALWTHDATVTIDGLEVLGAATGVRPIQSNVTLVDASFALVQNGILALDSTTTLLRPTFLYVNSDIQAQGGEVNITDGRLSVDGAPQVTVVDNATARLIDTPYMVTSLFFDTDPNTTNRIEAWWTLEVTVFWKDGPAINGSPVTISDVQDTLLFSGVTDPNGSIPALVVLSVVMSEGLTDLLTPHNISVVADPYALSTFPIILSPTQLPVEVTDWLGPSLVVDSPGTDAMLASGTLEVNGSCDDFGSGVASLWVSVDSPQWVFAANRSGPFAIALTNISDGPHTLYFRLVDSVGNTLDAQLDFWVDTTSPEMVFVTPIEGEVSDSASPVISGYTDPTAILVINQVRVSVDATTGWFSYSNITLEDGTWPVAWAAVDSFGNGASGTLEIVVDTTAPTLVVDSPGNGSVFATNRVTVSGHVDADSEVTIDDTVIDLLPNGDFTAQLQLAEGRQEIELVATDPVGNRAIGTLVLIIDLTEPTLHVLSPLPGAVLNSEFANVTGVTESGARVSINGGAQVIAADGFFTIDVAIHEGANTLQIAALDAAGNPATITLSLVRDTTAPGLVVNLPEGGSNITAAQVTITGTTDIGATVRILGDPVFVDSDGRFSQTVDLPEVGTLVITISATDPAGNDINIVRRVSRVQQETPTSRGDLVSTILDFNNPMGLMFLLIIILVAVVLVYTAVSVSRLSKQSAQSEGGSRPRGEAIDLGAERPQAPKQRAPEEGYGEGYRQQRYPEAPQRYPEPPAAYEEPTPRYEEYASASQQTWQAPTPTPQPTQPQPEVHDGTPEAFETSHGSVTDEAPTNIHHETNTDDITSILSGLEPGAGHQGVRPAVLPLEARKGTNTAPSAAKNTCPKCGEEVQATWSICPYCDHRLKGGAAPSPAAAPAASPSTPPKKEDDDLDSLLSSLDD